MLYIYFPLQSMQRQIFIVVFDKKKKLLLLSD